MAIFSTILQHVLMPEALGNASTALPSGGEVDLTLPLAAIAGTFFLIVLAKSVRSLWMLPPGPWGTPLYGMMKRIDKPLHLFLTDLTKKYGNGILSFKMGQETMVVLSDYKLIKEAFKNSAMTARPKTELINEVLQGLGIVNSDGKLWKNTRNYLLRQQMGMKNWHGTKIGHVEKLVQTQVKQLISTINEEWDGSPVDPEPLFNCAISNVICSMVMSKSFHYKDPQFRRFMHNFSEGFRLFTETGALMFMPWLKYFTRGTSKACAQLKANREEMLQFVKQVIDEHKESLDPENPRDLVDSFLLEMEKPGFQELFQDRDPMTQLQQVVLDLFSAGVETLKTSLLWSVVYMLHNPEVLAKVQAELDSIVGPDRLPEMADMERLPYTRATLYEVMRRSSVVPMGTTHATHRALKFEGYELPKNAHVIPLLCAVHMNPEIFPDPEIFKPERFLTEGGSKVVKPEAFMPFGVGQRMCLGDKLAERQFFLFFSSILHAFHIQNPSSDLPSLSECVAGAAVAPKNFNVVFEVKTNVMEPSLSASTDRLSQHQA